MQSIKLIQALSLFIQHFVFFYEIPMVMKQNINNEVSPDLPIIQLSVKLSE